MIQFKYRSGNYSGAFMRLVSLACVAVPVLVLIYDIHTILANDGFSATAHTVSEFALRNYGILERASMFLTSLLMVCLSIIWQAKLAPSLGKSFKLGSALLFSVGICFLLVAVFPTDLDGAPRTITGLIHIGAAALASGIFPIFLLITFSGLRSNRRMKHIARVCLFTGMVGLLSLIWMVAAYANSAAPGLAERSMMFLYLAWLAHAGYRLTGYAADI